MAIETPDSGFLNEAVRALFKHEEYIDVLNDVRTKLVPGLGSTIKNWRDSYYQSDEDPQSYFAQLEITLKEFREVLTMYPEAIFQIKLALEEIKEVVIDLASEQPEDPDSDDFRGNVSGGGSHDDSRSIFEDVDH